MAITPATLCELKLVAGVGVAYTSTGVTTLLDKCTLCNTTGGAVAVTLYLVPSGGAATATHTIISGRSIAAGETYICPEVVGHILESGATLQGSGLDVTLRASGRQVSGV